MNRVKLRYQERELYQSHLIHIAGFLEGIACRLDRIALWEQGNMDVGSLTLTADDCRSYARGLREAARD